MSRAEATSTALSRSFVHAMAAILVFSLWLTVSPYVLPEAIPTTLHLLFGVLLSGLAILFLYGALSQPINELGADWHILLLAILVLISALVNLPRDDLLFWSDVLTSGAILVLTLYTFYLIFRFTREDNQSTSDGEIDGD
jgi:uncharacterized protein YhhL (DUF1145 family)